MLASPQGEQRLVLVARALVHQPRLLIMDEVCQGLDHHNRLRVLTTLNRVVAGDGSSGAGQQQRGWCGPSLVAVSHHEDELRLLRCCTHELELKDGKVVWSGQRIDDDADSGGTAGPNAKL